MTDQYKPKKVCVFCGEKPESKTKEHIIPKWLIELTGDLNRIITLGISWNHLMKENEIKEMKFSFNSFQFPACKSCNEDFSKLESQVKPIIQKILIEEYITVPEIDILLDWFDKVRIGLWLGFLFLEKGFTPVNPKFHITRRIGDKDRSLVVYKFDDTKKAIQFGGTNLPCFSFNPSCFSLTINNYLFVNTSHDFIYSKNLGFPFPKNVSMDKESFLIEFEKGSCVVRNKLFRIPFPPGGFEIYQPIIQREALMQKKEYYLNEFMAKNTLRGNPTHGVIFIKEAGQIQKIEQDEEILLTPDSTFERHNFMERFSKFLMNMQIHILKFSPLNNTQIDKRLMNTITKGQKLLTTIKGLK
ncbi:hypothetical protein ACRTDU_04995 [Sunxiuqinia elliptica]